MLRALPGLRVMKPLRSRVSTGRRRSEGEEALDVGFRGWPSDGKRIGMNKGQVLALLVGEFLDRGVHAT